MTARIVRRIAIALLALYAFGQASVALAACGMDREAMAQAMAMPAGDACDGCAGPAADSVTAACVVHCSADLWLAPDQSEVLAAPMAHRGGVAPATFVSPPISACLPPGAPPRRILLHSFQI